MPPKTNKAIYELKCSISDLGPTTFLDGSSYNAPCDYQRYGFMVNPNFIDLDIIRTADLPAMKKSFLRSPKLKNVFNDIARPKGSLGIGERLQIITRTQEKEHLAALRPFNRVQRGLLCRCRNLVTAKAQRLLETTQPIDLVESVLLSMKNSEVQQTLHPDLPKEYTSKAVLAFASLEDNTTLIICPGSHKRPDLEHHTRITGGYGLMHC